MKPSEFWTRVLALPDRARQAGQDALDLRSSADALCEWGRLAMVNFQRSKDAADAGDMDAAEDWLGRVPPHPSEPPSGVVEPPRDEEPKPARKQRSDAGKPRTRKTSEDLNPQWKDDGGQPANPADVKAKDAARVSIAGRIRELLRHNEAPQTVAWIRANIDANVTSDDEFRDALKLLSLVSWRMQREGDSKPVEVWGTYKQLGNAVRALIAEKKLGPIPDLYPLSTMFGVDVPTLGIALREAP